VVSGLPFTRTVPVTGERSADTPLTGGGGGGPAGVVAVVRPGGGVVDPGEVDGVAVVVVAVAVVVVVVAVVVVFVVVVGAVLVPLFAPTLANALSSEARHRVLRLAGNCWQAAAALWRFSSAVRHADLGLEPATRAGSF
jgi:hypothetical protein